MAWSSDRDAIVMAEYGKRPTEELARDLGVSVPCLRQKARRLGLAGRRGYTRDNWYERGFYFVPLHGTVGRGRAAWVDEARAEEVMGYRWHAVASGTLLYARATVFGRSVLMHRLLLGARARHYVGHQDGNGLNNTDANIGLMSQ